MKNERRQTPTQSMSDEDLDGAQGGAANWGPVNVLEAKGFNPQPEPPARLATQAFDPSAGLKAKGFNPQPEPPAVTAETAKTR